MKKNIKKNIKAILRRRSSGFTLVELLVCFAILSVVALCVSVMMNAGTNMYVRVSKSISLSNKTQIALVQLKEFFIDCDEIYLDDDGSVYLYDNESEDGICRFIFNEEDKKVSFSYCETNTADPNNKTIDKNDDTQSFATDIKDFEITFNDAEMPTMATVKITAVIGQTEYTKTQNFCMRNNPVLCESEQVFVERIMEQGGTNA